MVWMKHFLKVVVEGETGRWAEKAREIVNGFVRKMFEGKIREWLSKQRDENREGLG